MRRGVTPYRQLDGDISLPGDKSISHRAVILNSLAKGTAVISNYGPGEDCFSTLKCLAGLGIGITQTAPDQLTLIGSNGELTEPSDVLDAGNSGTTLRLLSGVLAGQQFHSILTGDESLRSRPMKRIIEPLRSMGATIHGRQKDTLPPLSILGGSLRGLDYTLPVPSAQLKSCLLLAGLLATDKTVIREPAQSRDHTERMLIDMGADLTVLGDTITISPSSLQAQDFIIPGDISSGAFWIVAGVVHSNARILIRNVGLNQTRCGLIDVLLQMGANLSIENERFEGGEEVGDIRINSSDLQGIEISGSIIPRIIDELPVLAVAACFAKGKTLIRDAAELRFKETDRIRVMAQELNRMGGDACKKRMTGL
jgi:3-phosphoshikimate 1-carboxyvinyltransferase